MGSSEADNNVRPAEKSLDFIRTIIGEDLKANKNDGRVATRFPPEPNGYLHIGHAKSICLNFGIAAEYGGTCNLRYDDTNPTKEEVEYVESIQEDVHWLGFDWGDRRFFASDYFERLYQYAIELIRAGKAYVDSLSAEEIRAYRGTLTEPGKDSPYKGRSVEENLDLFQRMREGEFPDGAHVLRARIDMQSPNLNMRDPTIYRIRHASHHRTGDTWCIYPMYDFTHGLSDAIEGITHSICTLEFEDHRPLYDWFLDNLDVPCHPRQIEFARLNLNYTVMSKRKLLELVADGIVRGWDDPRMPTICGLRRRGYTPGSIRSFCDRIGVAKKENVIDVALLEHAIREDLNRRARRVMCVLRPLRLVIDNYSEPGVEELEAVNNPEDPTAGTRKIPFFPRTVYRTRRFQRAAAAQIPPAGARAHRAAALFLPDHLHGPGEETNGVRSRRSTAPIIRIPSIRRLQTFRRRKLRSTGFPRRTPSGSKRGFTNGCFRWRILPPSLRERTGRRTSIPTHL